MTSQHKSLRSAPFHRLISGEKCWGGKLRMRFGNFDPSAFQTPSSGGPRGLDDLTMEVSVFYSHWKKLWTNYQIALENQQIMAWFSHVYRQVSVGRFYFVMTRSYEQRFTRSSLLKIFRWHRFSDQTLMHCWPKNCFLSSLLLLLQKWFSSRESFKICVAIFLTYKV